MPINNADRRVKIYAWRNATRSSIKSMNITKKTETGAREIVPKIKINEIRLRITICPASMLANKRIIRAKGFENIPITSTGIIIGKSQKGTPGVAKICFQYDLLPLNWITIKVHIASMKVIAILPVTLPPKGGGNGTRPIRLFMRIKKKTVSR